jgi:transposase
MKSKEKPNDQPQQHARVHLGIDVSKRVLDACILPEDASQEEGESFVVANDQEGVQEILSRLAKMGASVELAVMEATGRYERLAATMLAANGISVAIVNPRQARDFAKAIGRLAKTDKIDAFVLARFARAVEPRASVIPDEQAQHLQGILARRRQLIEMLVSENNRLKMAPKPLAKRIRAHIEWLKKEIERIDSDLDEAIEENATFKANEPCSGASLESDESSRAPSWPSCPSSEPSRTNDCAPWWGSLPSTATPARGAASGRRGEEGLR